MKVEKISDSSIEFAFTKAELKEKSIDIQKLSKDESYAQNVIFDLIEEAETQYGISIKNTNRFKIYITTENNGINIIISSYDPYADQREMYGELLRKFSEYGIDENYLKQYSAASIEEKIKSKMNCNLPALQTPQKNAKSFIYCFNDISDIKIALSELEINFQNEVLYKYKQKYYLVLYFTKNVNNKKRIELVFGEYAISVNQNYFDLILQEYGEKMIKKNARRIINLYY